MNEFCIGDKVTLINCAYFNPHATVKSLSQHPISGGYLYNILLHDEQFKNSFNGGIMQVSESQIKHFKA